MTDNSLKLRSAGESVGWLNSQGPLTVSPSVPAASSAVEQARENLLVQIMRYRSQQLASMQAIPDAIDALIAAVRAESSDHSQCHDLVCNGVRSKPRGSKGVSCSCESRARRAESCPACAEKDQQLARLSAEIARIHDVTLAYLQIRRRGGAVTWQWRKI